ncbi:MAG TPA: MOSC domain-containing protein [Actinomycetota bacterium]|nr:MOSC domain-containing protein [Actinomycetota bacterium]
MSTLARISIAPVKGLRLSHPDAVALSARGIPTDRRFLLVDEAGELIDATDVGILQRIVPDYDAAAERLALRFPNGDTVEGPAARLGDPVVARISRHISPGRRVLGPFDAALSAFAGRSLQLLRSDDDGTAQDVHPLTVVSSASVRDLGARRGVEDLDPRRFRINLEVAGPAAYEEDAWAGRQLSVGAATIRVLGQIPRCVVTTLDPDTGEKDFPTLNELARYRPRIDARAGLPFGMYAEVVQPGRVAVGDPVAPVSSARDGTASAAGR